MYKTEIVKEEKEIIPPQSMEEIGRVMNEMDDIYRTNYSEWFRDESNLSYICTIKRPIFMKEFRANPKQGMEAIKWITSGWSLASIMEFVLKMFPFMTIDNPEFAELVSDLVTGWALDKIFGTFVELNIEFIKLLLIGESSSTCASFIFCFNKISRSDQTDLLVYLSNSLSWDSAFLRLFLLDFSMMVHANGVEHRALVVLIHQSMDEIDMKYRSEKGGTVSNDLLETSKLSGMQAPPTTPTGTPPASSNWESSLKNEEERLIKKLVCIQEFKVFLALFEVIMDIHEQHKSQVDEQLGQILFEELEL
jgi:hypothetical protein